MKKGEKLKLCSLAILCLSFFQLGAQEATLSSGGNAVGSGGSTSYSVGQVVFIRTDGSNGSALHGVQQPYEIFTIIGIDESVNSVIACNVYPNPASEFLILKLDEKIIKNAGKFQYQLFDMNGKILDSGKILKPETEISMQTFTPASYVLRVIEKNKKIKSFKITKNK